MNFNLGSVVKVFYFLTLNKYRRMFSFIGICTNFNKKTKSFTLKNFYGNEFVTISFLMASPNIVAVDVLTSYNFKFSQSKLHNFKKIKLFAKTDLPSLKLPEQKKDPLFFLYETKFINLTEKKRLRNKFRL
jgi:ribosomal protein L19